MTNSSKIRTMLATGYIFVLLFSLPCLSPALASIESDGLQWPQRSFSSSSLFEQRSYFNLIAQTSSPSSHVEEPLQTEKKSEEVSSSSDDVDEDSENFEDESDFDFEPDDQVSPDDSSSLEDTEELGTTEPVSDEEAEVEESDEAEEEEDETDETEKIDRLRKEAQEAFSHDPYRSLSFLLGPGTEKLEGRGGASRYSGDSQFLSLDLDLSVQPPEWGGFNLLIFAHFHEFVTKNLVRVRGAGSSGDSLRFQRYNISAFLQKKVYQIQTTHQFYLSLGLLISQLPTLETTSLASGAAELDSHYYTGIVPGGSYEYVWSERGRLQLQLYYLIKSLNSSKNLERSLVLLGVKYHLVKRFFVRTNIRMIKESSSYDLFCPGDEQISCRSQASIESQITYGQLGLGLEF
ncbi:MAG: hypothetical protein HRU09_15835 [Oligoflexales bacterium]|nr:hypothetical protein [Oligoflexales bacterium]